MPSGREGALEQEFPCPGKLLHRRAQPGAAQSWKTRQSQDSEGSQQTKCVNSPWTVAPDRRRAPRRRTAQQATQRAHTAPAVQRAGPGSRQTAGAKGGTGAPAEGRHTDVGSAHNPPGTALRPRVQAVSRKKPTLALQRRGQPGELKKGTQAPRRRGCTSEPGAESHAHKRRGGESEFRGKGSPHTSPRCRRIRTSACLASFSQQCRAGQGNRSTGRDPRDEQAAGGTAVRLRGPP